jgi:DNA-binding HxlR family transcriptional regulator
MKISMSEQMGDQAAYGCGLEAALEIVGGKWKVLILWHLRTQPRRFGELKRLVEGISEKMLIQQLKELEAHAIVLRQDFKEVPPRVEYSLTDFGVSLIESLQPLCAWGEQHMQRIQVCCAEKQAAAKPEKQRAIA